MFFCLLLLIIGSLAHSSEVVVKKTYNSKLAKQYLKNLEDNGFSGRIIKNDKRIKLTVIYVKSNNQQSTISKLEAKNIKFKIINNVILLKIFENKSPEDLRKIKSYINKIKTLDIHSVMTFNKFTKHQYIVIRDTSDNDELTNESNKKSFLDRIEINKKSLGFEQGIFTTKKNAFLNTLRSSIEGQFTFSEKFKFLFGGKLAHYQESNKSNYTNTLLIPHNTYLEYDNDSFIISLGYQCIVWGRLDAISPNDKVCPYDLNRSITTKKEDSRLSAPLLRTKLIAEKHEFDFFIAPKHTPHILPKKNSSFYPVDFKTGTIQGSSMPIGAFLTEQTLEYREVEDFSFGGRYTIRANSFDFSFNILKSTKYTPNFYLNPNFLDDVSSGTPLFLAALNYPNNLIIMQYQNETSFGYDFSIPINRFVIRGEHAITTDHLVTKEDLNPEEIQRHEFGLSAEYTFDSPNINLILFFNGVRNQTDNIIYEITQDNFIGFSILFTSWNETYTFESNLINSLKYKDSYFNNELSYTLNNNFNLNIGLSYFLGKDNGHFGFFKGNNFAYLNLSGDF